MKVAVTGASGFVGSSVVRRLQQEGHAPVPMVRRDARPGEVFWDADRGLIDAAGLAGIDAVVHLAGENIAQGRWTEEKKARIRHSRVHGTRFLAQTLAELESPGTLICASAIGFYGDRGIDVMTEVSGSGSGFLAEVCREWEAASQIAKEAGWRVVRLRIGVVLSRQGGALAKMLLPFKLGLGGIVGSGHQYWSWISLDDLSRAVSHVLAHPELSGAVNAVSPQPMTNREFTKTLGRVLRRPTLFPMPAFAAKILLGEMANELLLSSTHVLPTRLDQSGFQFEHPELDTALRALLR